MDHDEPRAGETTVEPPPATDAGVVFIGRIHTPWTSRDQTPRQGSHEGPVCTIEVFEPWVAALRGVEDCALLEVLYWMDQARRDLVTQVRGDDGPIRGTFAIRSPARPNPIATSVVRLESVEGGELRVRGLDCLDGTPLVDLKPDRSLFMTP